MKCLIMPDTHLKVRLVDRIDALMGENPEWYCVSLGDWADDWGKDPTDYQKFFDRLLEFVKKYRGRILLCWGNHDFGYLYRPGGHTGYMPDAKDIVRNAIYQLEYALDTHIQVVHRVDDVLFSHAGLSKSWFSMFKRRVDLNIEDSFLGFSNWGAATDTLSNNSPLWYRPHGDDRDSFNPKFMQVVGHTPTSCIKHNAKANVLYTDTWSTDSEGVSLGDKSIVLVDTERQSWRVINNYNETA